MSIIEILLVSISLAMDACAVALAKGLSMSKINYRKSITIALYFGILQFIMPIIGNYLGNNFGLFIVKIDHYIILIMLLIIGINMIKEAFSYERLDDDTSFKTMIILSLATSIDALAIGITFSFLKVDIILSSIIIGIITFILSFIGVNIGTRFKNKYGNITNILGGIILIIIGIKIFLEHINIF